MAKPEVANALFGARLFYNGIMLFVLIVFFFFDNTFRRNLFEANFLYVGSFLFLFAGSYYCFYTTGGNPGFAEKGPEAIEMDEEA
mmetsp:Transcript_29227/g.26633  ORF Transcript_29227/g.26633 Transcript_29227/m.26633 type:complete len:85 (-) Transcript_29227:9-263(-)